MQRTGPVFCNGKISLPLTHADKFTLKGALMLAVWEAPLARLTMDIDMLGQIDNSMEVIVDMIKKHL